MVPSQKINTTMIFLAQTQDCASSTVWRKICIRY